MDPEQSPASKSSKSGTPGPGSECEPHNPNLEAGDACFEWAGLVDGWFVIINDCNAGYEPREPDFPGSWVGERARTECQVIGGSRNA